MTRAIAYWVLMLIWLVCGLAWRFALIGSFGFIGFALIPFLLFAILGWQIFGKPIN